MRFGVNLERHSRNIYQNIKVADSSCWELINALYVQVLLLQLCLWVREFQDKLQYSVVGGKEKKITGNRDYLIVRCFVICVFL